MKSTDVEILAAVDGELCVEQAEKLRIIRSHMDSLDLCKADLESLILSLAEKYLPQLNFVMTVPGIQSFAAIGIISEIGVDMSVFPTSKHLCSWAGLTPQNNESPFSRGWVFVPFFGFVLRLQCFNLHRKKSLCSKKKMSLHIMAKTVRKSAVPYGRKMYSVKSQFHVPSFRVSELNILFFR